MKTIDIQEQPVLSLGRTARITLVGIRYRLFRSLVTVGVVAVAVAFLMNILSTSLIKRSIVRNTRDRVRRMRLAAVWASRLTVPETSQEILLGLARARPGDAVYRQAAVHGGIPEKDMVSFHDDARRFVVYLRFFARLEYGHRRKLVHAATGMGIFDHLCTEAGWERFRSSLKELKSVRFATPPGEFRDFLSRWPQVKARTLRVIDGQTKAIAKVAEALAGRDVMEALSRSDGKFGDAIRGAGFPLDKETAGALAERARRTLDTRFLERSVADPRMRQAVAGRVDVLPKDVSVQTMWDILRSRRHASWYVEKLRSLGPQRLKALRPRAAERPESGAASRIATAMTAESIVKLANVKAAARQMARAERIEAELGGGFLGLGERMGWLVFVSMLVCVVGISNAMLMSVTERFREIATLKCLGALDRFIMLMFVLEAAFLGIVGGMAGAVLGALLGTGITLLSYGTLVLPAIPIGELGGWILFSIVLGVVLAAVASVYPSFKAARLAPMEAMRIE